MKVSISKDIQYVGVDDTTIDLFESQYKVEEGVSYNSYLILDEKVAVMDTVDRRGVKEWEENLLTTLNGRKVDYLVVQHMEPDHAGSIERLVELFPEVTIVGNEKTFPIMSQFFRIPLEGKTLTVKEGDTLSLGEHTLTFIMAPMVHWPEVMVTYEMKEKVLFSADGFGKFGALSKTADADWSKEARRYYYNIVGKYGYPVQNLIKKASTLDIACICPLHGPILKENLSYYIDLYDTWSSYRPESKGVLVAYASIHGNTAMVAKRFADMLLEKGVKKVVVRDLAREDMSEVITEAFYYEKLVIAGASYDAGVFPCMQDFLHHLESKAYQKRSIGIIENGSWAPCAAKAMQKILGSMKEITILDPIVTIHSTLKESDLPALNALAEQVIG